MARQIMKITNQNMRRLRMPGAIFILAGIVAGCSSVPDALNPLEWFDTSLDFFSDEDTKTSQKATDAKTQNNVSTVSDRLTTFPKLVNVDQQQEKAFLRGKGLVADVEGRKYAPAIARQGETPNVLSTAPTRPSLITTAKAPVVETKTPVLVMPTSDLKATERSSPREKSSSMVSGSVPGQDDFQNRFAKRLATIRAEAAKGDQLMQYLVPVSNQFTIETVVVSSSGIDTNYGVLGNQYLQPADAINSNLTYLAKPMVPLSDNVVRVATIRFKNGSAKLSSRDRQILEQVVRLKKERGGRIHVVGHASSRTQNMDPVSHKMINFRVSAARADVVARELQRLGADRLQLQVDAVSDSAPEFLEVMPTGEAGNRRAEIYLDS
jgi:flagellar motor protein MotB